MLVMILLLLIYHSLYMNCYMVQYFLYDGEKRPEKKFLIRVTPLQSVYDP